MTTKGTTRRLLVLTAVLCAGNLLLARASRTEPVLPRQALALFPTELGDWEGGANVPFEKKIMDVLHLDDFVNREYRAPSGQSAWLYIGYYASQRTGETAHSPLKCLPGNGWEPVQMGTVDLTTGGEVAGEPVRISRYVVQKGIDRQVIYFWYQSHGRVMWNEYATKLFMMADAFRLNRTDGAIVRVVAPVNRLQPDEATTSAEALRFVHLAFPHVNDFLPR